ncbi:hypothetical protein ABZV78_13380, partial [Micromonospora sp. NPDC004540]
GQPAAAPWAAAPPLPTAPPVVPAPALPTWPPSTDPTGYRAGHDPAPGHPVNRPPDGPDLAGSAYGGATDGPGFATVSFPQGNPLENSGSLTGHILAQGWAEDAPATRSSNTKVVIVLAAALALLVAISLLVVFLANDALSGITGAALTG